jgi:hypothetical protein
MGVIVCFVCPKARCIFVNKDLSNPFAGNLMTPCFLRDLRTLWLRAYAAHGLPRSAAKSADQFFRVSLGVRAESAGAMGVF